ncbi:hypothetical protein CcI49_07975 [Frankia sp. CcI49]|nr:hypothetical protein CcI49_07975 [Frankia sp. CcI49]
MSLPLAADWYWLIAAMIPWRSSPDGVSSMFSVAETSRTPRLRSRIVKSASSYLSRANRFNW